MCGSSWGSQSWSSSSRPGQEVGAAPLIAPERWLRLRCRARSLSLATNGWVLPLLIFNS